MRLAAVLVLFHLSFPLAHAEMPLPRTVAAPSPIAAVPAPTPETSTSRGAGKVLAKLPGGPRKVFKMPTGLKPSTPYLVAVICLVPPADEVNTKRFCSYEPLKMIYTHYAFINFSAAEFTREGFEKKLPAVIAAETRAHPEIEGVIPLVAGHGMTAEGIYYGVHVGDYTIPAEAIKFGFSPAEWTFINLPVIAGQDIRHSLAAVNEATGLGGATLVDSCYSGECADSFPVGCDGITGCLTSAGSDGVASVEGLLLTVVEAYTRCAELDTNKDGKLSLAEYKAKLSELASYEGYAARGGKESRDDQQVGGDTHNSVLFHCPVAAEAAAPVAK